MASLELTSVEAQVLRAVKGSLPGHRLRSVSCETLLRAEALMDEVKFSGVVHDLSMDLGIDISPEEASTLFAQNPTAGDLANLFASKLQSETDVSMS